MSDSNLVKKVNFLIVYAVVITGVCCFLLFSERSCNREKVDELTVKRINVVDEEGHLRMVISNENRQHPGMMDGKNCRSGNVLPELFFLIRPGMSVEDWCMTGMNRMPVWCYL